MASTIEGIASGAYDITVTDNGDGTQSLAIVDAAGSSGGSSGGSTSCSKSGDVTFIDYDGTVLYSYSLSDIQSLSELPSLPSHSGLICQGWNWTLDKIKSLNRKVTVGATYITDDGATRLNIRIATIGRMTVPLYINQSVSNGVSIDWGDGSDAETISGTGYVNTSHTYSEPGDYTISLMPSDTCSLRFGDNSAAYCVLGSTGNNGRVYCKMLQSVFIGKNVTSILIGEFQCCYSLASITIPAELTFIGGIAFQSCYSLASITIPDGVTSIGNNAFQNCKSLASITIPDGVTSIGDNAFMYCNALASITIPDGVTSFGYNVFYDCHSLASITIPDGVTSIGNNVFSSCHCMRYYDFSACTIVPTLVATNAFNNIPSDCQMLIPSALYDEWSTATNWSTYASYMVSV